MPGYKIINMKYCHTVALTWNATTCERLNRCTRFKANSIFQPGGNATPADTTYDASGTDLTQAIWNNYRVLKSTITVVSVRAVSKAESTDPIMCGINITQNGANEGAAPSTSDLKGTDLVAVTITRDRYREAKSLMGAGKTNIFNANVAQRGVMRATYVDKKFFKGGKVVPLNRSGLLRSSLANPYSTALNTISPGNPTSSNGWVDFEVWACHPYHTGALAADTSVECLVEIKYKVLCFDKFTGKAATGDQ